MAKLIESRMPASGRQHQYSLDPPPRPHCEVIWLINGQSVSVGSVVGGLKVVGIGASGTMTVEVTGDTSDTSVSARIECPDAQPSSSGPMSVGSGVWSPCNMEPCKSALDAYEAAITAAQVAARGVSALCSRLSRLRKRMYIALGILLALLLALAICMNLPGFPQSGIVILQILALLAFVEVFRLYARVARTERALHLNEAECHEQQRLVDQAYMAMQRACPVECLLPNLHVDCSCH